ncbi:MAG: acetate--CoA ligase family protein, partial [Lewinella sp.]|nr:acetate--CoA ligase family protein [Lewinella sp.]
VDLDFSDLIDYLGTDYRTACILIYMETLIDARRFMSAARAFARSKPILVLRSGRSQEGPFEVADSLNWLAPPDVIYSTAFRRAGVLRVDQVSQLFYCAHALAMQPRPRGLRLAVITNAAGPGLLATDYLFDNGGKVAALSDADRAALAKEGTVLRPAGPALILTRSATADDYQRTLARVLKSGDFDGVLVVFTPYTHEDPVAIAKVVAEAAKGTRKTILASWMGEEVVHEARELLESAKVPDYRYPEYAVDTFLRMYGYHRNLELLQETPDAIPLEQDFQTETVRDIFKQVRSEGRTKLSETEGRQVLEAYHLPTNPHRVVTETASAVSFAEELGYPVVLKIASPDISDKSTINGVRLNLRDSQDVMLTFVDLIRNTRRLRPKAKIEGVLVEKQLDKQFELLLAAKRDPVFGTVLIFGRGGPNAHVYPDIQVGLPPLNQALARRITERLRLFPLFSEQNVDGGIDLRALEMTLVRFAYLLMDFPDIEVMSVNPFVVNRDGGIAVDADIRLTAKPVVQEHAY